MQLKEMFPDCFNKYFKFCIVRNPFERFVSKFYFRRYKPIDGPVFEWDDRDAQALLPQLYWITDREIVPKHEKSTVTFYRGDSHFGNIVVDEMIRMENLNSGLKKVFNNLGVYVNVDGMKNFHKIGVKDYKQFYTQDLRSLVSYVYRDDLMRLNYAWEDL